MFKHHSITIWMVVYDADPDRIYSFNKFENAVASIDGSIRSYVLDETPQIEYVISHCVQQISELEDASCIPIQFGNLKIVVYKWSLDRTSPIHAILSECYDKIEDLDLRKRIRQLFTKNF